MTAARGLAGMWAALAGNRRRAVTAIAVAVIAAVGSLAFALVGGAPPGPLAVSLSGNLATTLDPANLAAELRLERQISALPGVSSVSGPGGFLERQVLDSRQTIARDLARLRAAGAQRPLATLLVRLGYDGRPSLSNSSFVGQVIYGTGAAPKPSLRAIFPDANHALVVASLRPGVSGAQADVLDGRIERLVGDAQLVGLATRVSVGLP